MIVEEDSWSYHYSRMFPLCQFIENPKKIDARGHVSPTKDRGVTDLQSLSCQLGLFTNHTTRIVKKCNVVFASNVCHDVLVEELENEGDTVGEDQVLRHELKLVNVIDLKVFEKEEQNR